MNYLSGLALDHDIGRITDKSHWHLVKQNILTLHRLEEYSIIG
jgi:hypothetical protein